MSNIKFTHVAGTNVRELLANGSLGEETFELLVQHGRRLGWGPAEKEILMDMAVDTLMAECGHMTYEVTVRSLCHSQSVTADYLQIHERFQQNQCLLIMGDVGIVRNAWAQMIQPAVQFYLRDYNVLFVELPDLYLNAAKYLQHGPPIVTSALKFLCVREPSMLGTGVGGSVVIQALAERSSYFRKTHHVFNHNFPPGSGVRVPIDLEAMEGLLLKQKERPLQLWFAYQDEEGVFDRNAETPETKAAYEVSRLQARVESMRGNKGTKAQWDEILITDYINIDENKKMAMRFSRVRVNKKEEFFMFSDEYVHSLDLYFRMVPRATQDDLYGGLFMPTSKEEQEMFTKGLREKPELPAIRKIMNGPSPQERAIMFEKNRRRLHDLNQAAFRVLDGLQPLALGDDASSARALAMEDGLPPIDASRGSNTSFRSLVNMTRAINGGSGFRSGWLLPEKESRPSTTSYSDGDSDDDNTFFAQQRKRSKNVRNVGEVGWDDSDDDSEGGDESYKESWAALRGVHSWKEWSKQHYGATLRDEMRRHSEDHAFED